MSLEDDLEHSREHEMKVYLDSLKSMYANALIQNGEIYDIASNLTNGFRDINAEAVLRDSRIIKILRYAIAPSISQMKFGQFFRIRSIGKFENDKIDRGSSKYRDLSEIAQNIADFATINLDRSRFLWLDQELDSPNSLELASKYARSWTCSIAADQNAQTKYRNWRKDQQEHEIASALIKLGYTKSTFRGVVQYDTDINIGEYTQEVRVQGRTRQKADIVARSKKTRRLVLIEAKAVGVELDSTKRIKECCDKASDWSSSESLNGPIVVAAIAGFFNATGIENIKASKIEVIWEHRLSDLESLL